jgi:hypothetical protein
MSLCTAGDLVKWNHIYQIVQKIDDAGDALVNDYVRLDSTVKTFALANYRGVTITYRWTYSGETPDFCVPDSHGIVFPGGVFSGWFNEPEQYCKDTLGDLYFVGATPGSGLSENKPCFCCLKGKVINGYGGFTYALE